MRPINKFFAVFLLIIISSSCKDLFPDKAPKYLKAVLENTSVSDIKTTSVLVSSKITTKGSATTEDFGFCYSDKEQPTLADKKISLGASATDSQEIISIINELTPNTKYFIRSYLKDATQANYGPVAQFTTANLQAPKVNIADATDIKFNTFNIIGQITDLGTSEVTEYGHALSETNKEPTTADVITKMGTANAAPKEFKSVFTSLKANTTYYVRSYATNTTGTGYSEVKTVKTGALELAKVQTITISEISYNSVNVSGKITDQGTNPISDFGHVISKSNQNPTTTDTKTSLGIPSAIPKDYLSSFSGLELNTTYYTRSYAISEAGIAYGEVKIFKTLDKTPPILTTKDISNISHNSASISGNISTQGSHPVTDYGHVISKTNQNPTTIDSKTSLGATTVPKDFVSTFNGLEPNSTYYCRAYAISEGGIGYGEVKAFKTLNLLPPTVSTISAIGGSTTTGSADGKINSLGTSTSIIDYGFCYSSTNQTPTIADTKKSLGSTSDGNLTFKSGISNLAPNTTYYLRAYATSSSGTGYGEVKSFKTAEVIILPPTLNAVTQPAKNYCSYYLADWASRTIDFTKPFEGYCNVSGYGNQDPYGMPPSIIASFSYVPSNDEIQSIGICVKRPNDGFVLPGVVDVPTIENDKIDNNSKGIIWQNNQFTGIFNHVTFTTNDATCTGKRFYSNYFIKPYKNSITPNNLYLSYIYRPYIIGKSGNVYYGQAKTYTILTESSPYCGTPLVK
jgi:hypothetical protein